LCNWNIPPEHGQNIELPRVHRALEQVEAELRFLLPSVFDQSFYASRSLSRGQIKRFRLVRSIGEEDEAIHSDNEGNDAIEDEDPTPYVIC
jgi:hypothetical protein